MALVYSYQNREPAPLPERIRLPDGSTLRPPLSSEQLGQLGYTGPISVPSYDPTTQLRSWDTNDMCYRVLQLAPQEIEARAVAQQEASANYRLLYSTLTGSSTYQEIVSQAADNLPLTVACTQFLSAMVDAKLGEPNLPALQLCIDAVLRTATLNDDHLQEIYLALSASGLWGLITLGEFEPELPEPEPEPEPLPVVITPEEDEEEAVVEVESADSIIFSGGTTSAGITTSGFMSGTQTFGSAGDDVVIFDDPLA